MTMTEEELFPASDFAVVDTVPEELNARIERDEEDRNLVTLEYVSDGPEEGEPKREVNSTALGGEMLQERIDEGTAVTDFEVDEETLIDSVEAYVEQVYSDEVYADQDSVRLSGFDSESEGYVAVDVDLVYEPDFNGHSDVLPGTVTVVGSPHEEYMEDGEPVEEYVEEVEAAL